MVYLMERMNLQEGTFLFWVKSFLSRITS
jgi:hypothetical protein